jgi:hypothetical protein
LIGDEQRIELAGDVSLGHGPFFCCIVESLATLAGESCEPERHRAQDDLAPLAGGEVYVGSFRHAQDLISRWIAGLFGLSLSSLFGFDLLGRPSRLVVRLGIFEDRAHHANRIYSLVDVLLIVFFAGLSGRLRLGGGGLGQQALTASDRQQAEGDAGRFPRSIGGASFLDEGSCFLECESDDGVGSLLGLLDRLVAADRQKAGQRELSHRPGAADRSRNRGAVEISQNRTGAGVDVEVLRLLPGVLDRQEHGLGSRTSGAIESFEECDGLFGKGFVAVGEPLLGEWSLLVEIGDDHMDGFV